MENESIRKSYNDTAKELEVIRHGAFYQKHLLKSLNALNSKKDIESVENLHTYFDYNLNFRDKTLPKQPFVVKVHMPALNLAGTQFRLGQLD